MHLEGKQIARELLSLVKKEIDSFSHTPVVRIITVAPTPATESYLRIKTKYADEAGMQLEILRFEADVSEETIIARMLAPGADAVVVQLPLPPSIATEKIVNAIPLEKDADVLSEEAYSCFELDVMGALLPPVVGAIKEILDRANVNLAQKEVVIVGNGKLVGKPARVWCEREGGVVTVATKETTNIQEITKDADIIITGAGVPGLITKDMIKEGVILIDAGTSESSGAIVGDVDPACEEIASVFTPVPGGVGPIAVACLFQNTAQLLDE